MGISALDSMNFYRSWMHNTYGSAVTVSLLSIIFMTACAALYVFVAFA